MKKKTTLLAFWMLMSGLLSAPSVHAGGYDDSLYDPSRAVSVVGNLFVNFGPKSSKFRYDPRMIRAAEIARQRAHPRMTWHCWAYVKDALLAADVVPTRPTSAWAREAGVELTQNYGFKKLSIHNPYDAPVGAVIVYGGNDAGHVELRTETGFASDFISAEPYPRPVLGIYVKPA